MPTGLQPWQPTAPVSLARPSASSLSLSGLAASSRPPRPVPGSHTAPSQVSRQRPGSAGPNWSLKPGRKQSPLYPGTQAGCSVPEKAGKQEKDVETTNSDLIT